MAADVSSMINSGNSEILITRDLLGELSKVGNKDLDPDLQLPEGWEMPLDSLKAAGMVYPRRCNSPKSLLPSFNNKNHKQRTTQESELPDSKFPPLKFLEESCLELKLDTTSSHCQSVCTLDKVRSALQRAEKKEITSNTKKRSSPPSILTLSSSTIKEAKEEEEDDDDDDDDDEKKSISSTGMFAAACPGCLLYVITLKTNPKCPRCNSTVPFPLPVKKPRIDLNASV